MWTGVVAHENVGRPRIATEAVGRRECTVVIAESGDWRSVRVLRKRLYHLRRLRSVPDDPMLKRKPAPAEVVAPVPVRHLPPPSTMHDQASAKIGRNDAPIDGPGNCADRDGVEQREQGDLLAKSMQRMRPVNPIYGR